MPDQPRNVLNVQSLKQSDNRPPLFTTIVDINEAEQQPIEDTSFDGYDGTAFSNANRIELHLDHWDATNEEYFRVADGIEAQWDGTTEEVSVQLNREHTAWAGAYSFEWVLIHDEPDIDGNVPTSANATEVQTVPKVGYFELEVERPTLRNFTEAASPDPTVTNLTVTGILSGANDGPVELAAAPGGVMDAATKGYADGILDDHRTGDVHGQPQPPQDHGTGSHDATVASSQDLADHETANTNVHGVGTSAVASRANIDDTVESHRANGVHGQPQPPQAHDHRGDLLLPDIVQHGVDDAAPITEVTTPEAVTFTAGADRDVHLRTDVTLTNPTAASVTEDITVDLYEGVDATGTLLLTETRSVTVAANTTAPPETFIAEDQALGAGDYHIAVSQSGVDLSIDETVEYTEGAEFTTGQDDDGDRITTDQRGRERARFDAIENRVTYPQARVTTPPAADADVARKAETDSISAALGAHEADTANPHATTLDQAIAPQRGAPTTTELADGERLIYTSDGTDGHAAGDLVSARNNAGTIVSQVIAAAIDDA